MIKHTITQQEFTSAPIGSLRDGFGEALVQLGKKYWNVVALTADLGGSLRMNHFQEAFPQRFFEVGVAEQNMIGMAAGMAKEGLRPFAGSFAAFSPGRTYDQIRVSVCYSNNPVTIVGGHAGITVGPDGASHQMCEDIAMMRALPHMQILVPSDVGSAQALVEQSMQIDGPIYLRLSRAKTRSLLSPKQVRVGEITQVKSGGDITFVAMGVVVDRVLELAFALEALNISVEVLVVSTIKPLEKEAIIRSAQKTKHVMTFEEHQIYGGLGSAVAEVLGQHFPTKMDIVGIDDVFGESGAAEELLDAYGFSHETLLKRVQQFLG